MSSDPTPPRLAPDMERLQAERDTLLRRLQEAEDVKRLTENLAGVGYWTFEPKTGPRSWSPSIFEIFGLDPTQGPPAAGGIDFFDPEHRTRLREHVAGVGKGGRLDEEYGITRGDGRKAFIRMTGAVERDAEGAVTRMYGAIIDITEAHLREEALQLKTAEAQSATAAKSEFLANMSHEIRTPLTAVIGYAELMAKIPGLPEKARVYADRVVKSGAALNDIVDRILDFSKIEAGRIALRPEPTPLGPLFDDALDQVRTAAAAKGLSLDCKFEGGAPEAVLIDRARVLQVLSNLLGNAVTYTATGGVQVRVRHDLKDQRLHVSVQDSGPGIEAGALARLFQRFVQGESGNARRYGGVGLGLAIVRGLVELMEGAVTVESTPGQGTTFTVEITAPAISMEGSQAPAEQDAVIAPDALKILMADDVPANRELVSALLSPFSPRIIEASDGAEAIALAEQDNFDLILMDVQMPGVDGLDATRAIRSGASKNRNTPIIAVSASVLPGDVQACLQAGMNDHIPKPISPRTLITKVARWAPPSDV